MGIVRFGVISRDIHLLVLFNLVNVRVAWLAA
jgi:hypothetical protein